MACAPQAVREAEDVVAQADSLWHAGKQYGIDEGDSATLAQAYKTLEAIPLPFREGLGLGSPYAHACYHYGKLLRAKENPVEAMQAFIAATHSGTKVMYKKELNLQCHGLHKILAFLQDIITT